MIRENYNDDATGHN